MALFSFPKEAPVRSEPYRRLVATLPCWLCGVEGLSQAAHPDEGKGGQIKTSDARVFPLCSTTPGRPGCHAAMGTHGQFARDMRRRMERQATAATQAALLARQDEPEVRAALIDVGLLEACA